MWGGPTPKRFLRQSVHNLLFDDIHFTGANMNNGIDGTKSDFRDIKPLSADEVDQVSGGIAPLIGWGIAVTCGAGFGLLAGWVAKRVCAK
jgi:hypothetical protein